MFIFIFHKTSNSILFKNQIFIPDLYCGRKLGLPTFRGKILINVPHLTKED